MLTFGLRPEELKHLDKKVDRKTKEVVKEIGDLKEGEEMSFLSLFERVEEQKKLSNSFTRRRPTKAKKTFQDLENL